VQKSDIEKRFQEQIRGDFTEVKGMRTNLTHHSVATHIHNPFPDRQQEH